jgi:hypothetical protein
MIQVRRVIEAARDRHPSFSPSEHPDGLAVRFLEDYQRDLLARLVDLNPSSVSRSHEVTFPILRLADPEDPDSELVDGFSEGVVMPPHKDFRGATAYTAHAETPLNRIEWENRLNSRFNFAIYPLNGRIFFTRTAADWKLVQRVVVDYTPEAEEITSIDQELILPDAAYLTCVEALAAFFGARSGSPIDLTLRANHAETRYLEEVRRSRRARRITRYIRR